MIFMELRKLLDIQGTILQPQASDATASRKA